MAAKCVNYTPSLFNTQRIKNWINMDKNFHVTYLFGDDNSEDSPYVVWVIVEIIFDQATKRCKHLFVII